MFPACARAAGMNLGFPDICNVPAVPAPIPTPFPNMAMHAQAAPFAQTVFVAMVNALNMLSMIPLTTGDEAGSASPIKGPGRFTLGNPIVHIEMSPGINLLCPTTGNNMINALGSVLVASALTVFYTYRDDGARALPGGDARALSRDDVLRLDEAVAVREPVSRTMLDGAVGCLAVTVFTPDLPTVVYNEITSLRAAGMRALALDLRGCPGGDLDACARLTGDFIEPGAALWTRTDADGDDTIVRARGGAPYPFPLVLLVDRRTASAAELFAGSLQAHGRAVVVGERTLGKGSAQQILPGVAGEPGARYATVATFTLPDGELIEGRGIRPDIEVAPGDALDAARVEVASLSSPNEVR
jgi:carboxyl-terminal processing protease